MTIAEKTYEDYEHEFNLINTDFPNARFTIAIDYDKLDDVLSLQRTIYVLDKRECYCYCNNPVETKVFKITSNEPISNRIVLKELIRRGHTLDCNHHFLEGFHQLNSAMFEIMKVS